MAITLLQVNALLEERGRGAVTEANLHDALDFALGFYQLPYDLLYGDDTPASVILAIALLSEKPSLTATLTASIKSKEITGEGSGSVKTTYADAPVDPYPYISGLLAAYSAKATSGGITFGRSVR